MKMREFIGILLVVLCVLFGVALSDDEARQQADRRDWLRIRTRLLYPRNSVNVRINSYSEKELRISYGKVLAMETYLSSGYRPEYDMVLRQLTDGHRILQAVYQGGILKECDYSKDSYQMLDFISSFMASDYHGNDFGDVLMANKFTNYTQKNVTIAHRNFADSNLMQEFSEIINIRALRKECRKFLHEATSIVEQEVESGNLTDIYAEILDNTDPEKFSEFNKILVSKNPNVENLYTRNHVHKRSAEPLKRERRATRSSFDFNSVLIFPGTKWCGKGDLAKCYDDLGEDQELDMCCRDHDCCPFVIPPFSRKFGVFNYRFHSLLHCDCDQRFRGCLRQSVSSMANMIGKIYFNILGSKCFEFEETQVCTERSWWGRCQTYENQTLAAVKSQVSFIDENGEEDYHVIKNDSRK
ncbi:Phospholipase A2 [Mactra antiquata]